jgi:hypothetical protein
MRELGVEEEAWWGKLCQGWLLVKENGAERHCPLTSVWRQCWCLARYLMRMEFVCR